MARDDLFKRSFEAGTAFFDMTRDRAEALVKELVKAGEVQKGKAQKAIDEVLERSRKGAEELRDLIRREVSEQIGSLGLATKDDIDRLEAKLSGAETARAGRAAGGAERATGAASGEPAGPGPGAAPPGPTSRPAKAAPVGKAGPSKPRAAKAATKTEASRKTAPNPVDAPPVADVPPPEPEPGTGPAGGPPSGGPAAS